MPHYFKTKNFNSFVRQLNMYGFHKVKGVHDQEFKHPFFREGHAEYLCYIRRRYAQSQSDAKVENTDGDVSPSRYFDLRQQFSVVSEKVETMAGEVDRLNEENARLNIMCREMILENQKSLQKSLLLLFSVLGQPDEELRRSLDDYLLTLSIDLEELMPVLSTVSLEHLLDQNLLPRMFKVDNCRTVVDGLMAVLSKHLTNKKILSDAEKIKQLLLKQAFGDINQCIVVPTPTPRLSLSVMEDVAEVCNVSTGKKSESFEELFHTN